MASDSGIIRLSFTVEYYKKGKDFHWILDTCKDIWPEFSSGLTELWPDEKLSTPGSLSFRKADKGIELICRKSLVINGVSVQKRLLKTGDRIIIGPLRIFYQSFELIDEPEATPFGIIAAQKLEQPKIFKKLLPAALILAAAGSIITVGCIALPRMTNQQDPKAYETVFETVETPQEAPTEAEQEPVEGPLVIPPGGAIPEFDVDILFFHAHPDDESLDFGGLMILADSAGLRTGLVTFTNGESGLDTYPDRPITGNYPDHNMVGEELAEVRTGELLQAADVLGVDLLIRLGLKNHPYNGIKDELPPERILKIWGGVDVLSELLLEIIAKTTPETVAAPEAPGKAREHFEHEAVGYLASVVMKSLISQDSAAPKRFITCVDPRQNLLYSESSKIDADLQVKNTRFGGGKNSLREIQLVALSMHKTQNDAVNVGKGFLPEYSGEYYIIQSWQDTQSWDEWIASFNQ
jgi:LmbE family N-acetylglucosaminyl deacetylase